MEINRSGAPNASHTVSATSRELAATLLGQDWPTDIGRSHLDLRVSNVEDPTIGETSADVLGFVQWTME